MAAEGRGLFGSGWTYSKRHSRSRTPTALAHLLQLLLIELRRKIPVALLGIGTGAAAGGAAAMGERTGKKVRRQRARVEVVVVYGGTPRVSYTASAVLHKGVV